jgi:hypothetical protein
MGEPCGDISISILLQIGTLAYTSTIQIVWLRWLALWRPDLSIRQTEIGLIKSTILGPVPAWYSQACYAHSAC